MMHINLSVWSICSLIFTILCLIYLMGLSLETYLFVQWLLLFCVWFVWWVYHYKPVCLFTGSYSYVMETYLFVHFSLLLCDRNIYGCSLVLTILWYKPIFFFNVFYYSVIKTYLFVHFFYRYAIKIYLFVHWFLIFCVWFIWLVHH